MANSSKREPKQQKNSTVEVAVKGVPFSNRLLVSLLDKVAELVVETLPKRRQRLIREPGLELLIVGAARIKSLNARHRNKRKVTDVLSFPGYDLVAGVPPQCLQLGSVVICYPVAVQQAREYGVSVWQELTRLLVHGALHIVGFDHELSAREERRMQKAEDAVLLKLSRYFDGLSTVPALLAR